MKKIFKLLLLSLLSCPIGSAMILQEQDLSNQLLDGAAEDDPRLVAWHALRRNYPAQLQEKLKKWYTVSELTEAISQLIDQGFCRALGESSRLQQRNFVSSCKLGKIKQAENRYTEKILLEIKKYVRETAESYRKKLVTLKNDDQFIAALKKLCEQDAAQFVSEALTLAMKKFQIDTELRLDGAFGRKTLYERKVAQLLCKYPESLVFEKIQKWIVEETVKTAPILSCHHQHSTELDREIEQLHSKHTPASLLRKKALHQSIFSSNNPRKTLAKITRDNPNASGQEISQRIEQVRTQAFEIAQNLHRELHALHEVLHGLEATDNQQIVTFVRLTRKLGPKEFANTLARADDIFDFLKAIRADISAFLELERKDNQFVARFQAGIVNEETNQYLYQIMDLRDIDRMVRSKGIAYEDWDGDLDALAEEWKQKNPKVVLQLWQDEFENPAEVDFPAIIKLLYPQQDWDRKDLSGKPFFDAKYLKLARECWQLIKIYCNSPLTYKFARPTEITCNFDNIKALRYYPSHHSAESTLCIVWKTEGREQFDRGQHRFEWDPYFKCPKRHERLDQTFDPKHRFPDELNPASRAYLRQFAFILDNEDLKSVKVRKTFRLPDGTTKKHKFVMGISGMLAPQVPDRPLQGFESQRELEAFRDQHSSNHGIFLGIVSPEGYLCHLQFHDKTQQKEKATQKKGKQRKKKNNTK